MLNKFGGSLRVVLFLSLVLLLVPSLMAQSSSTGALTGVVTDPTGAVIPNATVTLTSDSGQVRTATTGADGSYRFALLNPGTYRVKFEAAGFSSEEIPAAVVDVTETEVLNRALTVGAQSQSVTVEANVETVQTASSTLGTVVSEKSVVELPLSTRNFTNLLSLSAGAAASVNNATSLGQGNQTIAVNGASTAQNNYQQDGVNVSMYAGSNTLSNGGNTALPPIPDPDSIQEFKIQTSTYDASFGRNSGANVNVVTKSGTNAYHGTAFEFFRNTVLNANDFFLKYSEISTGAANKEGVLNQNQYGGVFGGPVKKDKLFFFASYQGTWQKNGFSQQGLTTGIGLPPIPNGNRGTCPAGQVTIAQMIANCDSATASFITALGAAVCPNSNGGANAVSIAQDKPFHNSYTGTPGVLATRTAGVDVNCNGNNISPQAIQILQLKNPTNTSQYYVPSSGLASTAQTLSSGGYITGKAYTAPAIYKEYQGNGNWDYVINSKNTLSGKYFALSNPATYSFPGATYLPGTPEAAQFGNQIAILKLTTVLSNSLVNEARFSYYRNTTTINMPLNVSASQLGIIPVTPGSPFAAMPGMAITGLFTMGYQYQQYQSVTENTPSASDQLSWTHGKHTIRTGFDWTHTHYKWLQPSYQIGLYTYDTFADFLLGLPGCSNGVAGCSVGAGQTGGAALIPSTYSNPAGGSTNGTAFSNVDNIGAFTDRMTPTGLLHYFTSSNLAAFVQDDFKLSSRLTVNVGLRWEYDEFTVDQNGDGVNIWSQLIATQPIPGSGCVYNGFTYGFPGAANNVNGCSFAGYVAPSNYSVALRGPLPAGVYQNNRKDPTASGPPWDNFAPRVGFAWQPLSHTNRLVLRGGFGYFYDYLPGGNLAPPINQEPPYVLAINNGNTTNFKSASAEPFLPTPLGWGGGARWVNFTTGQSSNLNPAGTQGPIARNLVTPLTYSWNIQGQYEFLPSWVVEIGYVGSHGQHQEIPTPINVSPLASATNPINCGFDGVSTDCITSNKSSGGATLVSAGNYSGGPVVRAPYLGFQPAFHAAESSGGYKFNSFQATVRKTLSHGLILQGAYTYSNALITSYIGNPLASPTQFNVPVVPSYGPNPSYRPQRLSINYSWDLPFGHHEGLMDKLLGGWSVSGVTTIQNGQPLTVTDTRLGTAFGAPGAPVVAPALYASGMNATNVKNPGSLYQQAVSGLAAGQGGKPGVGYLNSGAFCAPSATAGNACLPVTPQPAGAGNGFGYGNSPLGVVYGPGQNNWDISLSKITRVGGLREDATLQFRAEFFNAFNHPQFSNPTVTLNSTTTFGTLTSENVNPRLIQFGLKYRF